MFFDLCVGLAELREGLELGFQFFCRWLCFYWRGAIGCRIGRRLLSSRLLGHSRHALFGGDRRFLA